MSDAQIPTPRELREGRTRDDVHILGRYRGDVVSVRAEGHHVYVTVGDIDDLEYPIDLNGSLQNWVRARLLSCPVCGDQKYSREELEAHLTVAHHDRLEEAARALGGSGYGCGRGHTFDAPVKYDGGAAWPTGYCPVCGDRAYEKGTA